MLTAADIAAGNVNVAIPAATIPANGILTVSATVTDQSGNVSPHGSDSAITDTAAPQLTAQIDPASDSGTLGDGITSDPTPTIIGTGEAGDTIKVTMPVTGEVLLTTVKPDGTWSVTPTVDVPNGTSAPVQVQETDPAGNTTTTNVPLTIDTSAPPAPTVTITTDANNDGFMNRVEVGSASDVAVSIGLPNGAKAGDTLHITDGTTPQTHVLSAGDITAGIYDTTVAKPAEGVTLTVTATLSDPAGNVSMPGSDAAKLDTSVLGNLQLSIVTDANNDGYLNQAELGGSSTVQVQVTLPVDAVAGDSLTINATGNAAQTIVLTQAQIDAHGVLLDLLAPANGNQLLVSGQVKDPAGNVSNIATDSATVDTSAPQLTAQIDPASDSGKPGDGVTNDQTPTIIGTGEPGNAIQVTMPVTGEVLKTTVHPDGTWSVTPTVDVPNGTSAAVQVLETDPANNTTTTSVPLTIDTTPTVAPGVSIVTDTNNDQFLNAAELGSGPIVVHVTLPAGAVAGDSLSVTGTGGAVQTFTLTAAQLAAGSIDVSFAAPPNHTDFVTTATLTDVAGNVSPTASDNAVLQLDPPGAPSVTITTDANNDGYINNAELAGSPSIGIAVGLPSTAVAGDSVVLTVNGVVQAPVVLTAADITAGKITMPGVPNPGEGATLEVAAQIKDAANNLSPTGTDSATIDTTPSPLTAALDPASDSGVKGDHHRDRRAR